MFRLEKKIVFTRDVRKWGIDLIELSEVTEHSIALCFFSFELKETQKETSSIKIK